MWRFFQSYAMDGRRNYLCAGSHSSWHKVPDPYEIYYDQTASHCDERFRGGTNHGQLVLMLVTNFLFIFRARPTGDKLSMEIRDIYHSRYRNILINSNKGIKLGCWIRRLMVLL
ncbi:uncharacterized protein LOC131034655 [Cryptomeria japonica]|uniref:uncharacterized protein LOC131034655 n=1 Tax=Cryptomeria japonica TaxID=3369 RepID=UPI0025AC338E|nr:uncharacterized protein LOC131034655 [Cryptomeria japonica]